ncbi:hypothetical protein [Actibacterium ureilyticum]|uniref:hypothetical protein n=1 Tax=Actibacterium ureilyticum TaxID=1590614 RepID=UPI000BAAA4A9|nr:hypothetical protein [Actibacterium ureilyticum]
MHRFILPVLLLAACTPPTPAPPPDTDLPLVRSYRAEGDQCMLVGENGYTNQFLDHTSDLVACPTDYEGLGVFVTETGAVQVDTYQGWTLFTVARA